MRRVDRLKISEKMECSFCLFQFIYVIACCTMFSTTNALIKPPNISAEMYCTGCELTIKELDSILSHPLTLGIEETVDKVLQHICDVEHFKKHEMAAEKVLTVCKHIKDDAGLKEALITVYSKKHDKQHKATYLEVTQKICGGVLKACPNVDLFTGGDKDGGIVYDQETQDFKVEPGKKVKVPRPVQDIPLHPAQERMDMFNQLKDLPEDERRARMKEHQARAGQDRMEMMKKMRDMTEEERAKMFQGLRDLPEHERREKLRDFHMMQEERHGFKPPRRERREEL